MKLTAAKNNVPWLTKEIARLKEVQIIYRSKISALEAALEALASPAPKGKATQKDEGTNNNEAE